MLQGNSPNLHLPLLLLAGLVLLALLLAGMGGWLAYGSTMLLATAETGLSWCF
jgi:hypothetical protein